MRVALAQLNPTVGDVDGNTARIVQWTGEAARRGADLVVFPEQAILGYPAKDLLLRRKLLHRVRDAVERVAAAAEGITSVVGYVSGDSEGGFARIGNAAAVCQAGRVACSYDKMLLPTYDVFDEQRYFRAGLHAVSCWGHGQRAGVSARHHHL